MPYLIVVVAILVWSSSWVAAQPDNRFQGLDRNNDGRITRDEWRGSDRSFARHDWNNDGVLSGDELLPGNRRGSAVDQDFDSQPDITDWSESHFRQLDHNGDQRLTRSEWHYDVETFRRIDRNRDGVVSRAEFLGFDVADDDRGDRFDDLDANRDGRISRYEWHASDDAFRWLDRDGDGVLSRVEVLGPEAGTRTGDWFANLDVDRNGRITSNEWHWSMAAFNRRDTNGDGSITRDEFGSRGDSTRTQAYQRGYERGLTEGRGAGREDKQLRNRWDLEGQRELQQADSGYRQDLGSRAEYQEGYRAGFRAGYAEGFGRR